MISYLDKGKFFSYELDSMGNIIYSSTHLETKEIESHELPLANQALPKQVVTETRLRKAYTCDCKAGLEC
ncbi:MAG: hypothetical protein KC422_01800 [Trueperaceae bacterium]|nr:hypothetical protein [Trueperaceae bacterium]